MRLTQTLSIAILSTLLVACGGSLEGEKETTPDPVVSTDPTDPTDPVIPSPAEPGVPSSFVYLGANPQWIGIKGAAGPNQQESSIITFKLIDLNGKPVGGTDVDFSLIAPNGTTINPLTGTTNNEGLVSTTILSGSISGSVRINVITSNGVSGSADDLAISTGLPSQETMTMALTNLAPEAWDRVGVTSSVTVSLADRYHNAVPDGTSISFTTEGGAINDTETGTVGACLTKGSKCVLTWRAQNPRPPGNKLSDVAFSGPGGCAESSVGSFAPCINPGGMGQPYGGRATITSYTLGEERFVDNDQNGLFEASIDTFYIADDFPEVFYDHNEDGIYQDAPGTGIGDDYESYHDLSGDGSYTAGNVKYNGLLCSDFSEGQETCSKKPINVRKSAVITMVKSTLYARKLINNDIGNSETDLIDLTISSHSVTVYLADIHNNPPPTGTIITVTTENGQLSGPTTFTVPNMTKSISKVGPFTFGFNVENEATPDDNNSGTLTITAQTPEPNNGDTVTPPQTFTMSVTD